MIAHRFLLRASLAAVQAFVWVFIFHMAFARTGDAGYALASAALLYGLSHLATIFLTPLAARLLGLGAVRMMAYGVLVFAAALVFWGEAFSGAGMFLDADLVLGAILFGAFRALYTVPYALARTERGAVSLGMEIAISLVPAGAGFLIASVILAPSQLLFVGTGIIAASLALLTGLPEYRERYAWEYRAVFGELFEPRERRLVLRAFGRGIESAALFFLWPLAVFSFVLSYATLGLMMTASLLAILAVGFARARFSTFAPLPLSHAGAAAAGWILRMAAFEPISLVLVSVYAPLSASEGLGSIAQVESAENSTYLDEHSALKEVAHSLGCLAVALLIAIAANILSLTGVFITAFAVIAFIAGFAAYHEHASTSRGRMVELLQ